MVDCQAAAQFWVALPATLGAITAAVAAFRNGHKTDQVKRRLAAHADASAVRFRAYSRVITDLAPRLETPDKGD